MYQPSEHIYLNLFGTSGTALLNSDDDSGVNQNAMIVWTCVSNGMYYFRVHGNFKKKRILAGNYTISVQ